jgi:sulfite exporter TauE/SafE
MIEALLLIVTGLVGSAHCLGMCGPLALTIGSSASTLGENVRRQLVYGGGRIFTYSVLGAVAGFAGWRLARLAPSLVSVPALLAIMAGGLMIWQGAKAARLFGRLGRVRRACAPEAAGGDIAIRPRIQMSALLPIVSGDAGDAPPPCLAGTMFGSLLATPTLRGNFLAGLFTGLLPCGLVYAVLALAVSSRSVWAGAASMALFGVGTLPAMVLAGSSASLLSRVGQRHLFHLAAWCLIAAGAVCIARGCGFVSLPGWTTVSGCPLCNR